MSHWRTNCHSPETIKKGLREASDILGARGKRARPYENKKTKLTLSRWAHRSVAVN
jgi:hypothetical protein